MRHILNRYEMLKHGLLQRERDKIKPMDIKFRRSSEGKQEGTELEIKFLKELELK